MADESFSVVLRIHVRSGFFIGGMLCLRAHRLREIRNNRLTGILGGNT